MKARARGNERNAGQISGGENNARFRVHARAHFPGFGGENVHGKQKVRENGGLGRKANFPLLMIYVGKRSGGRRRKAHIVTPKTSWGLEILPLFQHWNFQNREMGTYGLSNKSLRFLSHVIYRQRREYSINN